MTGVYPNPPGRNTSALSEDHLRSLVSGSGIAPDLLGGVLTVEHGWDLPPGYSRRQRRRGRGMLFEGTRPNGETFTVYRPDGTDPDNPGHKYECVPKRGGGPGNVLYVHPSQRHLIPDTSVPVVYVEGIKKALSLVSAVRAAGTRVLVVGVLGTWNWMGDGKPIPDMLEIPVEGREATVLYDSDLPRNPGVRLAGSGLAEHLSGRGARVSITYLPDQDDGSKTGADDFLAAGGTLAGLWTLTRPYDPEDLATLRLSRDGRLRAGVRWLRRRWWDRDWMRFEGAADKGNWQRGHTARDVLDALIGLAPEVGKADGRGVVLRVGTRRLAELAAKTAPSVAHALKHLEAEGIIEILPAEARTKARSYRLLVPSATLYSMEKGGAEETGLGGVARRCKGLRGPSSPRLMWTSPGRKADRLRGVTPGTRRVRQGRRLPRTVAASEVEAAPAVRRLGPHRCAVLDALENAGGELHLGDLCEALQRRRPREVRSRLLPMLEEAGIVVVEGDVVRLAGDWLDRLEEERERKGEISRAEERVEEHRRERARYRDYLEAVKKQPGRVGREAVARSRAKRSEHRRRHLVGWAERGRSRPLSPLAAAVRGYLEKHPRDARQPAGWIGSTLWAFDLYPGRPTPAQTRDAIKELGGPAYLDRVLKNARVPA